MCIIFFVGGIHTNGRYNYKLQPGVGPVYYYEGQVETS